MLRINLVPEKTKKEINLRKVYSLIRGINYILIMIAILISAIFVYSKTFLMENSNPEQVNVSLPEVDNNKYGKKPREINKKLNDLSKVLKNNYSHLHIIKNVAGKIPAGISLSSLEVDTKEKLLKMAGEADLRDTLLELKEGMKQDELYAKVDFPLRNILKKEKINFSISAVLDLETLNEKEEGEDKKISE